MVLTKEDVMKWVKDNLPDARHIDFSIFKEDNEEINLREVYINEPKKIEKEEKKKGGKDE